MQKRFCDICGKDANLACSIEMIHDAELKCDSKAKIYIRLSVGFVGQSAVFGVPPDICANCFRDLISLLQIRADNMARNEHIAEKHRTWG